MVVQILYTESHCKITSTELTGQVTKINIRIVATYPDGVSGSTMSLPEDIMKFTFDPVHAVFDQGTFPFFKLPVIFRLDCHGVSPYYFLM
jgi:hypothetical protein